MRNLVPYDDIPTLGALLRRPYELLQTQVYDGLMAQGFPDIRPAHSSVFRYIEPQGSRVSDLADAAQMTKQSMAYLTGGLEALGYVSIAPDPDDGRAKRVVLTDKGRAVRAHLVRMSADFEARCGALVGPDRIQALRAILSDLAAALEKSDGK